MRISIGHLNKRLWTLNHMMEKRGSAWRYQIHHSWGYSLERFSDGVHIDTMTSGTKNELATYISAMCKAIWDMEDKA